MLKRYLFLSAIWAFVMFCLALPVLAEVIVDTAWVRRYCGPGYGYDLAYAIAVDSSGNVYVTGGSYDTTMRDATVKYYPDGDTAWVRRYDGPENSWDTAYAIAVDDSGNVYVTGGSYNNGTYDDYATIKYKLNGDTAWARRYNGPGNGYDEARDIAMDDSGNVYVTGKSYDSGSDYDYATIKYHPNGDTAWVRRYNGPGNGYDDAFAIAVDDSGNVYVTGGSYNNGTYEDYATIKYKLNGDTAWARRYDGPGNYNDVAFAIAVDGSGNVYVTGSSYGTGTNQDYATIKYVQLLCGDVNKDGVVNSADVAYLVNYLFVYGPAPQPLNVGDVNGDGKTNSADVVYLINYLSIGGPPPCEH